MAAALAKGDAGWVSNELDLDEVESLDEVADLAREAVLDVGADDSTVVVLIQQRDWFGLVRADGGVEVRAFVSDAGVAMRHTLGEVLLPELAMRAEEVDAEAPAAAGTVAESAHPTGPAGDAALLADLGVSTADLVDLSAQPHSADALTEVAELLGCPDPFESVP